LARSAWSTDPSTESNAAVDVERPLAQSQNEPRSSPADSRASNSLQPPPGKGATGEMDHSPTRLAPPDPTRRFREFTPEQRVEFARKGHGPGG
jgi:hypothetical protein